MMTVQAQCGFRPAGTRRGPGMGGPRARGVGAHAGAANMVASGPARKAEKFQGNWRRWRRRLYLIYAVGLLLVWRDRADHRRNLHVLGLRYKNVSSRGCVLSGLGGGD